MAGENFHDLVAFVAVAEERSFTRAATKLGVSQSALSQTIRSLEAKLGIRLLTRTTRSVAPTEAGERLLRTVAPRFAEINAEMAALSELRDKPAGTVRLTATENAADTVLWPTLEKLLLNYPDIKVEIVIDYGLTDIVAGQVDASVRFGEQVARDMIAVRIGPDIRRAVVGSPAYFAKHAPPRTPQDLTSHDCINLRLPTHGLYAWEFERTDASCVCAWMGRLRSIPLPSFSRRPWPDLVWRISQSSRCSSTSTMASSSGCSQAGARPILAITSIIRAAASRRPPSPSWWMPCATLQGQAARADPNEKVSLRNSPQGSEGVTNSRKSWFIEKNFHSSNLSHPAMDVILRKMGRHWGKAAAPTVMLWHLLRFQRSGEPW
jgi:DNA-binding transcriptional LysR family regulator